MSQKHFNINTFIVIMLISAVIAALGIVKYGAKDVPYNYDSSHLVVGRDDAKIHADCDADIQELSDFCDSLYERNTELETIVAGYEHQDHSRLTAN